MAAVRTATAMRAKVKASRIVEARNLPTWMCSSARPMAVA